MNIHKRAFRRLNRSAAPTIQPARRNSLMHRTYLKCVGAMCAIYASGALRATAQPAPSSTAPVETSAQDETSTYGASVEFLVEYFSRRPNFLWNGVISSTGRKSGFGKIESFSMTENNVDIVTNKGAERLRFNLRSQRFIRYDCYLSGYCEFDICSIDKCRGRENKIFGFWVYGRKDARRLMIVWPVIYNGRPLLDPANDKEFQDAISRTKSDIADHSEDMRRIQLKAETLVQANHINDAIESYRTSLLIFPNWGVGHYNLAPLCANVSRYREAINEMRRYVYLAPNAPDARAATDQIYKWEALDSAASSPTP